MSYRAKANEDPEPVKLTPAQLGWLERLHRGQDPWDFITGRSEHGGARGTVASLTRRGLIDADGKLTAAGLALIPRKTITADASTAPAECYKCHRTEPRKDLWGLDANNITTASLDQVKRWVCPLCFLEPAKPTAKG